MAIDACTYRFAEMATAVLPGYMATLRLALASPHSMSLFCKPGVGVRSILSRFDRRDDFSGCYVFLHDSTPFYVGISRGVIQRLRQHVMGTSHFDASLAYQMATGKTGHVMTRGEAMKNAIFRTAFDEARSLLKDAAVAFIEIANPLELYLFEAYCAMELDTCEWNTFRTH